MGDCYGTGIEIGTEIGPVGITEKKKFGPVIFQVFMGKKEKN